MNYKRLKDDAELLKAVIEASSDIIIITDARGNILFWNSGAERFLGYKKKEVFRKNILSFIVDEHGKTNGSELKKMLKERQKVENYRCFYRRKDDGSEPVLLTVNLVYDKGGRVRRVVGIAKSIRREAEIESALIRKNKELEFLSMTDHLTGLYNRRFFASRIEEEVRRALHLKYSLSLLFIDFDELKKINDLFGHAAGDAALIAIARVIADSVKETDIVARYGGDEFCVIVPGAVRKHAMEIAERIRRKIEEKKLLSGREGISLTVSIGVSELNQVINTSHKLLNAADAAAHQAKCLGKNRVLSVVDLESNIIQV